MSRFEWRQFGWQSHLSYLLDIVVVVAIATLGGFVTSSQGLDGSPLQIVFALLLVFVLPGYALVAALFPATPRRTENRDRSTVETAGADLSVVERLVLSIVGSICFVALVGFGLGVSPVGIRLRPLVLILVGSTVLAAAVAGWRRHELSQEHRFGVPLRRISVPFSRRSDSAHSLWRILVLGSLLIAVVTVTYAVSVQIRGETYTEFYVVTENESGDHVASNYSRTLTHGEATPVVLGIENNEQEAVRYGVAVKAQRVAVRDDENRVVEQRELERFQTMVPENETTHRTVDVAPTITGDRVRLTFLLYRGEVPDNPTRANAYRDVHLWVTVHRN